MPERSSQSEVTKPDRQQQMTFDMQCEDLANLIGQLLAQVILRRQPQVPSTQGPTTNK
jgi:hypothetical protein